MKQLYELKRIAFNLRTINNAQKSVAANMNTTDAFERGMKAGYEIATESPTPYLDELEQLISALQEQVENPYMIDDLTYEGVDESA